MSKILYLFSVLIVVFLVGCASTTQAPQQNSAWQDITLTNVQDGSTFTIKDFSGRPILIETFAVWCPTCLRQQKEMKRMQGIDTYNTVHIALDVDPNENAQDVKEHAQKNGFDWAYVVSPQEMTQILIDEFGVEVVNAPLTPVILVCGNGTSHFLDTGVKLAEELVASVGELCT